VAGHLLALAVTVALAGSCDDLFQPATPAPPVPSSQAAAGSALAVVETLPARKANNSPPYHRDAFGQAWADVDHNGCDTRNDILRRDLTKVDVRDSCIVLTGQLNDPYTGKAISFSRSRATAVQIDHVVALSDAWQTGASKWSPDQRLHFANDPENLLAVDGPQNEAKGDDEASEWLPPNRGYRCRYVARQIGVKARYHLWVEPAEKDAMRAVLATCPDQPVLGS
jgi:hypothetical protein